MTLERNVAKAFRLTDENWLRHANPWSVWTRYTVLPILVVAFWSRVWIGWWAAVPAIAAVLWMFVNPILFGRPATTRSWASRAVLGERVWMNRDTVAVPEHHRRMPHLLNLASFLGTASAIWGIVRLDASFAVFGTALTILGKSWFLDRMVWIYRDMMDRSEEYARWDY